MQAIRSDCSDFSCGERDMSGSSPAESVPGEFTLLSASLRDSDAEEYGEAEPLEQIQRSAEPYTDSGDPGSQQVRGAQVSNMQLACGARPDAAYVALRSMSAPGALPTACRRQMKSLASTWTHRPKTCQMSKPSRCKAIMQRQ